MSEGILIRIHYNRHKKDYYGWNMWIWEDQNWGLKIDFTYFDEFGAVANYYTKNNNTNIKVGLIVRKSTESSEWAEKDIEFDRFLIIPEKTDRNQFDIYLIQSEPDIIFNRNEIFKKKFIFHYFRYDDNYNGWNIWSWNDNQNHNLMKNNFIGKDDFGGIYVLEQYCKKSTKKLGFIIRKNMYQNDFALSDIVSQRYIYFKEFDEENIDVYIMQNDVNISFQDNNPDKTPMLLKALFDKPLENKEIFNKISIELSKPCDFIERLNIKVIDDNLCELMIDTIIIDSNTKFSIVMSKALKPFENKYIIKIDNYKDSYVSMDNLFDTYEFEQLYTYENNDLGATYKKTNTKFRLWAPTALKVELLLYKDFSDVLPSKTLKMLKDINGTWVYSHKGDLENTYYLYRVYVDGQINEVVDPYAFGVSVNGKRAVVMDLLKTDPENFRNYKKPELKSLIDSIIYELHVKDFSSYIDSGIKNKNTYLAFEELDTKTIDGEQTGIAHLVDLGITHIHLLPVLDFITVDETDLQKDEYNWGYDPQNYFVPEGSYSTNPKVPGVRINEFKRMIKSIHKHGIRVVLDVVFTHTAKTEDSNLNLVVPGYYYRKDDNGNFSNGSGCGNEIATQRKMVRKFIIDVITFWIKEYRVDGFRFDLMGLIDIETMNQIRKEVDKLEKNILIYGEGWVADWSPLSFYQRADNKNSKLLNNVAIFNNVIRDGIKGDVFDKYQPGFSNGGDLKEDFVKLCVVGSIKHPELDNDLAFDIAPSQIINYVSSHDNLTLWDKINFTNTNQSEKDKIKIFKLCYSIIFLSQGIPFIQSGDEMLRTKHGNHNTYNLKTCINQLDWSRKSLYKEVFEYFKLLINFRKQHIEFRINSISDIKKNIRFLEMPKPNMVGFLLKSSNKSFIVIFNANKYQVEFLLPKGKWMDFFKTQHSNSDGIAKNVVLDYYSTNIYIK